MIDTVGFDSNAREIIEENWETPFSDESLPNPSSDEDVSSLRSSNRKLRGSLITLDYSSIKRECGLKLAQNPITSSSAFNGATASNNNKDDISEDLKRYFFDKMEKRGVNHTKYVYDQYLKANFSPKAAIALTDRSFFPKPHEKHHGDYLKNVIGNDLFKKEQAARKGKGDWIEKTNSAAIKILKTSSANSKASSNSLKKHEYKELGSVGGYLLGIAEIIAGGAIIVTGTALEVVTIGGFTIGFGMTLGTGMALIGTGLATTTANARNVSLPKLPKYDPVQDILNKLKENPRKWDEPGSPPIRGDQIIGDGTTSPYPGFDEWKGKGNPSSGKGAWYNPDTEQSLHPDLNHMPPKGPHWDYVCPEWPEGAELYLDGNWIPK